MKTDNNENAALLHCISVLRFVAGFNLEWLITESYLILNSIYFVANGELEDLKNKFISDFKGLDISSEGDVFYGEWILPEVERQSVLIKILVKNYDLVIYVGVF